MKLLNRITLTCSAVLLLATSCQKEDDIFTRENDKISCDCTEQSIEQNFLCTGEWVADCSGVDWITVSPERGSGNGEDYGFFKINVKYNKGAAREGTINLIHGGTSYPIQVNQGKCEFAYGTPYVAGNLFQNIASTASINLPYIMASGEESVEVSCTLSGASDGVAIPKATYSGFAKGKGELSIPIAGKPTQAGTVNFAIKIDGVDVGTCSTKIVSDPDALPDGLPVGWNFYALEMTGPTVRGSKYDYSWTVDATNPTAETNPLDAHRVLSSSGNENAYLTAKATVTSTGNYTFNPGIQIRGLMENDYFLFVIPVKNISADEKLTVEASMGSAGSGPGYYALEYSSDNTTWKLAEGSTLMTVFGASAQVHYYVPTENTSSERTSYNKETDKGYRKYTFPLTGIDTIYDGNLYLRLRVCMNRRSNGSESTNAIASAWADLKGFEVTLEK